MSFEIDTAQNLSELKRYYFADESRHITIYKGQHLLTEDSCNDRLYLVIQGKLNCYLNDESGENFEVQQSTKNMFLGVYSFFSYQQKSYLTVVAAEECKLAYIEKSQEFEKTERFAKDFLPVIVHEIYLRQVLSQQMSKGRQAAIKKLYESEKMVLLGQLAAGIAHELNNAIGILERNTEWLIAELGYHLKSNPWHPIFLTMLQEGQQLSTTEIRAKRDALEKQFGLPSKVAKQLAKANLPQVELANLIKSGLKDFDTLNRLSEAAIALHDMRVASTHAAHVVKSMRDLGNPQNRTPVETSLYETLQQALVLTKNLTKHVKVQFDKQVEGKLLANPGDLVQVWVNLIKNACESMAQAESEQATLSIVVAEEEEQWKTWVSDTGTGITNEVMERIFEPHYTTKVNGLSFGLGLGLSIVKKIIESYRGTIQIESQPGKTTFCVQIPKNI